LAINGTVANAQSVASGVMNSTDGIFAKVNVNYAVKYVTNSMNGKNVNV
jgi:hypothetical protein